MDKEKKYFLSEDSQLNADDATFAVSPNSWVNAENIRTKSTDSGVTGTVESIGGTLLLSTPQPSITFVTIGEVDDTENSRICYFKKCTTGPWDKITCWDDSLQQELDVLLSSQVTGGLNFDKNYLIHSANVVNGLLYWTDNLNDQRRVNIDAGIKLNNPSYVTTTEAYTSPIDPTVITVLRKPPAYPLGITKVEQTSPVLTNNFIETFAGQFSYRYYYRDGEVSVPAVYSLLAPYNSTGQDYNRIDIIVPVSEYINQDVQSVDILMKYGNENTFSIIKSWDKSVTSEAAEIAAHNAGTTLLTYSFYNDTTGAALDEAYSLKPFDSVPIRSNTLEIFNNRLGFGNNLEGYTTPYTTSLDGTLVDQSEGGNVTATWIKATYNSGTITYYAYLADTNEFFSTIYSPPFPATVDYTFFTFRALGWGNFTAYLLTFGTLLSVTYEGSTSDVINAPSPTSLIGQRCFKSGGAYKLSVTFYDYGDRKCGVTGATMVSGVSMGQASFKIPDRSYDGVSYVTSLNWTLSNLDAVNEIPDWATHYSVLITNCLSTRFFLQARSKTSTTSMTYVTRDTDNSYLFTTSAYDSGLAGVGVDITNLQNFGMGYVYSEGDIINIHKDGDATVYRLSVIAQDGRWLVCELQDLGTLDATTLTLFEIYTPYIQSVNEPYYEVAQTYPINNAGTLSREYSATAGSIRGDVTLLDRGTSPNNYLTEVMSPNDKYYLNWYTDRGRPNFIDRIGQQLKTTNISYSNVLIPGTRTNGLSSFDALDETNIPQECGSIQKLQITSKVQDEKGIVMLAICANETASLYIGEVQLYGSNAPSTLAQAPNVIGTINILKGSRGTTHPESVTEYRGNVYWWDNINGRIVQYSSGGLFDISSYKMTRFWKLFSDLFNSMTTAEIEALGSRPFVFTTVDPYHNELLISIPKLSNTPPKGYMPDYPSMIFPFDIYDAQEKTIVYKLDTGEGKPYWMGAYTFAPEYFATLWNKTYAFKNGHLYLMNQTENYNELFGVQYSSKIMVVSNQMPTKPKMYNNTTSESNLVPSFVYMYNNYPIQQSSDLVDEDFRDYEGNFYATIKRNKLVSTATGYTTDGLMTGAKMRNVAMWIMFEWRVTTVPLELKFIDIGYSISTGNPI